MTTPCVLVAEHLLLAFAGTALGILVVKTSMALLPSYDLPGALPMASLDLQLDAHVLLFAVVLLAITELVGLIPALGTSLSVSGAASTARGPP